MEFAFIKLNLNKVELDVYEFNPRAIYVYEKTGFKKEGIRRQVFYKNEQFYNSVLMGILREEYLSRVK